MYNTGRGHPAGGTEGSTCAVWRRNTSEERTAVHDECMPLAPEGGAVEKIENNDRILRLVTEWSIR